MELSEREIECLKLLAIGLRPEAISRELAISKKTVEKHVASAKLRLNAKTREHAVAIAMTKNLIEIE